MSRAERQAKWRQRSDRKRVEVNLPVDAAARLDDLAAERGQSRANVLADLLAEAAPTVQADRCDSDTHDMFEASTGDYPPTDPEAVQEPERTRPQPRYQATTRRVLSGRNYRTVDAYRVRARHTEIGMVWTDPGSGSWRAVAADDDGYVLAKAASRREVARRLVDYAVRQGWI
jgi:hypothetical protein